MKTTINLIANGQLKAILQLMFESVKGAPVQYNFQPLPSYWAMKPVSREMLMDVNKK